MCSYKIVDFSYLCSRSWSFKVRPRSSTETLQCVLKLSAPAIVGSLFRNHTPFLFCFLSLVLLITSAISIITYWKLCFWVCGGILNKNEIIVTPNVKKTSFFPKKVNLIFNFILRLYLKVNKCTFVYMSYVRMSFGFRTGSRTFKVFITVVKKGKCVVFVCVLSLG